jgi:hypothetical protein
MGNLFSTSKEDEVKDIKHKLKHLRKRAYREQQGGQYRLSDGDFKGYRINTAINKLTNQKNQLIKEMIEENNQTGGRCNEHECDEEEEHEQQGGGEDELFRYKYKKYKSKLRQLGVEV